MVAISPLLMEKHFQFKAEIIAIYCLQRTLEELVRQFHWSMVDWIKKLLQIQDSLLRKRVISLQSSQLEDSMVMLLVLLEQL